LSTPRLATLILIGVALFVGGVTVGNALAAEPNPPVRTDRLPLSSVPLYDLTGLEAMVDTVESWNLARWLHTVEEIRAQEVAAEGQARIASGRAGASPGGSQTSTSAATPSGSCYGGPLPAYIYTRESGGDPNAVNPSSGARGCGQVMPYVHDAHCSDLGYSVPEQHECERRLIAMSGLQPWSATR
jgi:hypothetical protein